MSIFEQLAAPFPPDAVSWRVGSTNINKQTNEPPQGQDPRGMALAYLDARDVMDRLDQVCGPEGWQCRYSHVGPTTVCDIGVRAPTLHDRGAMILGEWIWKADGAGATDVEAEKGMLSDAFKRSAVRWGVGRYLYGLGAPWVKLVRKGRTWLIDPSEASRLRALLARDADQHMEAPRTPAAPQRPQRATAANPQESRTLAPDAEFPGVPEGNRGKTSHFARQAGDDKLFKEISAEIVTLESAAAVGAFIAGRMETIKTFPAEWRATLREELEAQKEIIRAQTGSHEDDFPGDQPMGRNGSAPVAGRNGAAVTA